MNYLPFWVASEERLRLTVCWQYICHMYTLNYILKLENWAPGSPPSSGTAQRGLCLQDRPDHGPPLGTAGSSNTGNAAAQRHPSQHGKCPAGCRAAPLVCLQHLSLLQRTAACQGWPRSSRCHKELLGRAGTQPQLLVNGTSGQKVTDILRKAHVASCDFI